MPGAVFQVDIDLPALLAEAAPTNKLVTLKIPGGKELIVSPEDFHYNDHGNEVATGMIAEAIRTRFGQPDH